MSDYQAIYDAIRSKLSNCNVGDAVTEVARYSFDISNTVAMLHSDISMHVASVREEMVRPSVLFKPVLSIDGDMWCALLGVNLQEGLAAFGPTPDEAMRNFDAAFKVTLASLANSTRLAAS